MRRSARARRQVDYRQLAAVVTRISKRRRLAVETGTQDSATSSGVTEQVQQPAQQSITLPPLQEGVVQCTTCKMRFIETMYATQKHNRHHPDCSLFDRSINMSNTSSLRYEAMMLWIKQMKVKDLQQQLKKYHHKISGKKVHCLGRHSHMHHKSNIRITHACACE